MFKHAFIFVVDVVTSSTFQSIHVPQVITPSTLLTSSYNMPLLASYIQ
jgi:hypothetical protein